MPAHPTRPAGTTRGATARLDIHSLDAAVQTLFSAGLAASTQSVYRTGSRRFLQFCGTYQIHQPYPVTERTLSGFVAHLHGAGLAPGTVKGYLAAVRHSQIALGMGDPHMGHMPQLEYVVKGLKRTHRPNNPQTRLPITPAILRDLRAVWDRWPGRRDASMLWAASCMCFFGFLRAGEVVVPSDSSFDPSSHLAHGDVRVDNITNPHYLEVRIKASKTDPFRQGVSVFLGVTGGDLCPVAAILSYMVLRGQDAGPFFRFARGNLLTRERFVVAVRSALESVGYHSSHYAGHSFRIGAATTAAQCGISDALIKTLGRWQSASYMVYIRTPRDTLCSVARRLVGPTTKPGLR